MAKVKKHYPRKTFGRAIVSNVGKISDGDTFRCDLVACIVRGPGSVFEYPSIIADDIPVRIKNVDCPPMRGASGLQLERAIESYMYLERILKNANIILLDNMSRGKYFRILADVVVDGELLSQLIIQNKYGRPYRGGPKKPWIF